MNRLFSTTTQIAATGELSSSSLKLIQGKECRFNWNIRHPNSQGKSSQEKSESTPSSSPLSATECFIQQLTSVPHGLVKVSVNLPKHPQLSKNKKIKNQRL